MGQPISWRLLCEKAEDGSRNAAVRPGSRDDCCPYLEGTGLAGGVAAAPVKTGDTCGHSD